jgi:hypothetical protein
MAVRQPAPGLSVWRTPHRRHLAVDQCGTRPIPADLGDAIFEGTPLEQHFAAPYACAADPAVRPVPRSGVQSPVVAPEEQQGVPGLRRDQVEHPADHDEVVTGFVHGVDRAVDMAENAVEDR